MIAEETLLTVHDLAGRYRVREGTVRHWLAHGLVPGARREHVGSGHVHWVVPDAVLSDWIPPGQRGHRGAWDRDLAGRLRQVEAERDEWQRRAEIARRALERIAHDTAIVDPLAVAVARRALENLLPL